jgi:hypothetical protein
MTGQFVGSPAYAPPEALVRGQSGTPGDVYGLGATLSEAAAGRWPRADATTGGLLAPMPPLRSLVPALQPELAEAIDRAVAIEPEQRPSAAELADAIAAAGSASVPGVAAVSVPGIGPVALPAVAGGAVRWKPWAIGGAVILAIALLAVATRGSSKPNLPGTPGALGVPGAPGASIMGTELADRPTEIRANPPPGMDGKQTREWNKIFDELEKGHFEGARHKLDEFEENYGETDETRALKPQLDALGPDVRGSEGRGPEGRGEGRGRGKKHKGND